MTGFNFGEPVLVLRSSTPVGTVYGGVDDQEHRLYLPYGSDVEQGDVLMFRGVTRRVTDLPWSWRNPFTGWEAGLVVRYEEAPAMLPDLGSLYRPSGARVTVNDAGDVSRDLGAPLWTGPCRVEPSPREAGFPTLGDERMSVLPFLVQTGLDLVDVQPDDAFQVTKSRDGRLLVRTLFVTAIRASSTDAYREVLCRDNQG